MVDILLVNKMPVILQQTNPQADTYSYGTSAGLVSS